MGTVPSSAVSQEPLVQFSWPGDLKRDSCELAGAESRDLLASAAWHYDWTTVLQILRQFPSVRYPPVNTWHLGGSSWYTPLHRATHGGAPRDVVEQLIALGAWRTLKTRGGQRAVDIARQYGHEHLVPLLEPKPVRRVDAQALERIQEHFHELIRHYPPVQDAAPMLRLPDLGPLTEYANVRFGFAISGLFGSFGYWLDTEGPTLRLAGEIASRMFWEERSLYYEVTPEGARFLEGQYG